jgi:hypothetical protein
MLIKAFYGKCPDKDWPDHWLLFSSWRPSPVTVSKCGYHCGPIVLEDPLKEGLVDSVDGDKEYTDREPQPCPTRKEELVP